MTFRLFLEGAYDWQTTQIAREIIKVIKRQQPYLENGHAVYVVNTKWKNKHNNTFLRVQPEVIEIPENFLFQATISPSVDGKNTCTGVLTPSGSLMKIMLNVNTSSIRISLTEIQGLLVETIKHEFTHLRQIEKEKELTPSGLGSTFEEMVKYLKDKHEIDAFVSGMYKQAKFHKKPFISILDEWIQRVYRRCIKYGISEEDAKNFALDIRQLYAEYARKKFPKAQF